MISGAKLSFIFFLRVELLTKTLYFVSICVKNPRSEWGQQRGCAAPRRLIYSARGANTCCWWHPRARAPPPTRP